jgi:hypothetical protein
VRLVAVVSQLDEFGNGVTDHYYLIQILSTLDDTYIQVGVGLRKAASSIGHLNLDALSPVLAR